ncbi:hypothetical protein EVAR_10535_1 [Eumeta japonica]|uniref:Uncharacterized protein n=1 Tax=Eumeta variegata TaxID=151549 RepID=A0A4C1THH8_EUMVA|nr:hypothetical protein EVAR_10535_1 [Eumeta japonica]
MNIRSYIHSSHFSENLAGLTYYLYSVFASVNPLSHSNSSVLGAYKGDAKRERRKRTKRFSVIAQVRCGSFCRPLPDTAPRCLEQSWRCRARQRAALWCAGAQCPIHTLFDQRFESFIVNTRPL